MNKLLVSLAVVAVLVAGWFGASRLWPNVPAGSFAGPEIPSHYITWGDQPHYAYRRALTTATTTVCAFQSPAATSSLVYTGLSLTTGSSTATTIHLATSTTAYATTTLLTNPISIASGALASIQYTGTSTVLGSQVGGDLNRTDIMPPETWVVWGVQGFTPNSADVTKFLGTCGAEFKPI